MLAHIHTYTSNMHTHKHAQSYTFAPQGIDLQAALWCGGRAVVAAVGPATLQTECIHLQRLALPVGLPGVGLLGEPTHQREKEKEGGGPASVRRLISVRPLERLENWLYVFGNGFRSDCIKRTQT